MRYNGRLALTQGKALLYANAKKAHTRMRTDETLHGAFLSARYERKVGEVRRNVRHTRARGGAM